MVFNYIVRYGSTRMLAEFTSLKELRRNAQVVIRSARGTEWGEVLCEATDKSRAFLESKGDPGRILREANGEDYEQREKNRQSEQERFDGCNTLIAERKLQMQLVDTEFIQGGEPLLFYYLAEKRVDFRELVKALASKYKSRIEMRQIGVRDEAKLLADYGDCGKPTCCNTHLSEMPPVSMKMAKLQKATLDPNKISGRCSRLKCCLRYEYDTDVDMRRDLPRVGATVVTQQGQGKVTGQEVLAQQVWVQFEDHHRALVEMNEIITVVKGEQKKRSKSSPDKKEQTAKQTSTEPPKSDSNHPKKKN